MRTTTPVANLPPGSWYKWQFATRIVDTSGKFAAGIVDTGGKFAQLQFFIQNKIRPLQLDWHHFQSMEPKLLIVKILSDFKSESEPVFKIKIGLL